MTLSTRAFRNAPTDGNACYPRLLGTRGAIACKHHLAAHAGAEILQGAATPSMRPPSMWVILPRIDAPDVNWSPRTLIAEWVEILD